MSGKIRDYAQSYICVPIMRWGLIDWKFKIDYSTGLIVPSLLRVMKRL